MLRPPVGASSLSDLTARIRRVTHIASIAFAHRTICLRALYCTATYSEHLERPHTAPSNARRINALRRTADELFPAQPVLLIDPVRTSGPAIEGYADGGQPVLRETLPKIAYIGAFNSDPVVGQDGCASALALVWFDDAMLAAPLEAPLADLLLGLSWDQHAHTYWE